MTQALTTEGFLALTLIMGAMLLSTLNVARLVRWPWNSDAPSDDYLKNATAAFFVATAAAEVAIIFSFLGGLITLFAPSMSWGTPETFGFAQADAAMLFAAMSVVAVVVGGFAAFRVTMVPRTENTVAITYIGAAFTAAGALYCLLLAMLVFSGSAVKIQGDFIEGALLIAAGSVVATITGISFRRWFVSALKDDNYDEQALAQGTVRRAMIFTPLYGLPMLAGVIMIAV